MAKAMREVADEAVKEKMSEMDEKLNANSETLKNVEETVADLGKKAVYSKTGSNDEEKKADSIKYVGSFFKAFKNGDKEEMKALNTEAVSKGLTEGTDEDGGFLVPTEFHKEILRTTAKYGVARKFFRVLPMATSSKNVNALSGEPVASMVGEAGTTTDSKPTFAQVSLIAKKALCNVIGASELIEDNQSDIGIWNLVKERIAIAFAKLEDEQCFNGAGTGNNHTGLLVSTNSDLAQVSLASTKTGITDATLDDLLALTEGVEEEVAVDGEFVMNRTVFNHFRKQKDSNSRYLQEGVFQESTPVEKKEGIAGYFWGFPVKLSKVFPKVSDSAAGKKFVVFGNGKLGGVIGDRTGLGVKKLTEGTINSVNLADTDQDALQARKRFGFAVTYGSALAILKTAAS